MLTLLAAMIKVFESGGMGVGLREPPRRFRLVEPLLYGPWYWSKVRFTLGGSTGFQLNTTLAVSACGNDKTVRKKKKKKF